MFQPLEWFIGLRYLRSRRWRALRVVRTAASLLGLALGVTALIVILSVLNGLETETRTRLLALSAHATISAPAGLADWRELEARFATVPGVAAVAPYVRDRRHARRRHESAPRDRARHRRRPRRAKSRTSALPHRRGALDESRARRAPHHPRARAWR